MRSARRSDELMSDTVSTPFVIKPQHERHKNDMLVICLTHPGPLNPVAHANRE